MATKKLVEGWDEDMSISSVDSSDFTENEDQNYQEDDSGDNDFYLEADRALYECPDEEFATDLEISNDNSFSIGIDFDYIHDQDMNYYQESPSNSYYQNGSSYCQDEEIDSLHTRSMLGDIETSNANDKEFDPEYDLQVNEILADCEELFLVKNDSNDVEPKEEKVEKFDTPYPEREQYEDYYDEFPEENVIVETPEWYEKTIGAKVKETKIRLDDLSKMVCFASASTREVILRMERDHNSPFCKLEYPRHPPLHKSWVNYWRFNCALKCKEDPPEPGHAHTCECEMVLLEHVSSGVSSRSKHIFKNDFPDFIMHTVELFQEFANATHNEDIPFDDVVPDTVYERPMWSYIKIRSNYKNELMLIVCGKGVSPLLRPLKKYFSSGPGRTCNVVSLYCINIKWSQKKGQFPPTFISGCLELRDKIGPISVNYSPKTNINFNSAESQQLGKIMLDYLAPTAETTVVELGCNFGVLSLMMAQKSDKVIGLNTLDHEIKLAEELKSYNNLFNVSFIVCSPKDVQTKCSSLLKKCISVAILNLATPFGKSHDVMKAVRNLPSLWRVAVYGSFSKEFRKHITVLTSKDEHMGDEFLPMRSCVLDKSPSNPDAFDIVILFERKSLIVPSVELNGTGPTVNIKQDLDDSCSSNEDRKPQLPLKLEKGFGNDDRRTKNPVYKPFVKFGRPYKKFGGFDSPYLPREPREPREKSKPEILPLPADTFKPLPPLVNAPFNLPSPVPLFKPKPKPPYNPSPVVSGLKIKDLKKIYDSPPLPGTKENQSQDIQPGPSTLPTSSTQGINSSLIPKSEENQFHSLPTPRTNENSNITSKLHLIEPIVCPPLPKSYNNQLESPVIKSEPNPFHNIPPPRINETVNSSAFLISHKNQLNGPPVVKSEENQFNHVSLLKSEGKLFDSQPLSKQINPFNCNYLHVQNQHTAFSKKQQTDSPLLVKNENESNDSLPSTANESRFDFPPLVKPENSSECLIPIKQEQLNYEDTNLAKEEGELSDSDEVQHIEVPRETIKCEPIVLDDDDNDKVESFNMDNKALIKCEVISTDSDSSQPMLLDKPIKTEPVDVTNGSVDKEPVDVPIKTEPINSPTTDLDEFANMVTPVHNPIAFNSFTTPSPPPITTNFTTLDGFAFKVQPNQSFLSYKTNEPPAAQSEVPKSPIKIKKEKADRNSDDEISIIGVKGEVDKKVIVKKERKDFTERKQLPKAEIKKEGRETEEDLRSLIEKRKDIQKLLDREREARLYKHRYDLSPSPVGRYRSSYSPSHRRYRSPYSPSDRRYISSPISPSSRRYRSPISPLGRRARSPYSPTGSRHRSPYSPGGRRHRSPYSPVGRRHRSPLSPSTRRPRSPLSPISRRARSPTSPVGRRARSPFASKLYRSGAMSPGPRRPRSPVSPPFRKRRSPYSPSGKRYRSPISPPYRGTSPYQPTWDRKRKVPLSPNEKIMKRSPTSPPLSVRIKSSMSPKTKRSSSPTIDKKPPKRSKKSKSPSEKHKKSKSRKSRSKLRSLSKSKGHKKGKSVDALDAVVDKKITTGSKCDDQWDIPGLSSLENSPIPKQAKVKNTNENENEKAASPAKSTSSILSNVSTSVKEEPKEVES